jgi:primosomal protein N' (replication factor Y)
MSLWLGPEMSPNRHEEVLPLELPEIGKKRRPRASQTSTAGSQSIALPVARVLIDATATHLAREFDYLVPPHLDTRAIVGSRVKVTFGKQEFSGFITARQASTDLTTPVANLTPLKRVVSPVPVLTREVHELARTVASFYGSTVPDILRFAIPPRHARAEAADGNTAAASGNLPTTTPWLGSWQHYEGGKEFLAAINSVACADVEPQQKAAEPSTRTFVWTPLPGLAAPLAGQTVPDMPYWAAQIASAAVVVAQQKRGVLIVAPDAKDVGWILTALNRLEYHDAVKLTADAGPELRYRNFLKLLRGESRVAVGTRSAAFAPVENLGLLVLWGQGDEALTEPHFPHFQAAKVLEFRSQQLQIPLLLGAIGRSAEAQLLAEQGMAVSLRVPRELLRQRAPLVTWLNSQDSGSQSHLARVPSAVVAAVRTALGRGPVLFQTSRTGYLPGFTCQNCREIAMCPNCDTPTALRLANQSLVPSCPHCQQIFPQWRCPHCGSPRLRATSVGSERTAEELGKLFPGVSIVVSSSSAAAGVRTTIPRKPALVVATPGAEPVVPGGYAVAVILDAAKSPGAPGLNSTLEQLSRWLGAAHLVIPRTVGGKVFLVGEADPAASAALVRFDPILLAERDLAERTAIGLPPSVRMVEIHGDQAAVSALLTRIPLATPENTIGPTPDGTSKVSQSQEVLFSEPQVKAYVRVPLNQSSELGAQVGQGLALRSAKREPGQLKVVFDPPMVV